jgi:hypothetical protein
LIRPFTLVLAGTLATIGGTTALQGQSLPSKPGHEPPPAADKTAATTSKPAASQPPATQPAVGEKTGDKKATTQRSDPEPRREPTPSEILKALTKSGEAPRPVVRPVTPGQSERTRVDNTALPTNAVAPVTPKLLPDGYRLVDRPGRLAREGDYWVFTFENRSRGEAEIPIRLLPNRLLEDMEAVSEGGTKQVVFVVSGEITEYHGVNYLLIQKLLTRPDLGNLK